MKHIVFGFNVSTLCGLVTSTNYSILVLLTSSTFSSANKYFGIENPIEQSVKY